MRPNHLYPRVKWVILLAVLLLYPSLRVAALYQDGAARENGERGEGAGGGQVLVGDPVQPVLTVAARDLPPPPVPAGPVREIPKRLYPAAAPPPVEPALTGPDPLLPLQAAAPPPGDRGFETPLLNFEGQGYTFLNPPDTNGDVGLNHYVQMINSTEVTIYNKDTGAQLLAFSLTSLGGCATGDGDPIVLYDHLADRWLLSEFGPGNSLCVFISQTPDPTGSYYSYQFTTPNFPDYPKYAVWPDGYYASTNEGDAAVYALERTAMLTGAPATSQRFAAPPLAGFSFNALTPGDWDGATPPPGGSPNYFMRHRDTEAHGPAGFPTEDFLEVWAFHVDWATPANSTFTQVANIATAEFDSDLCGLTSFSAIAMPGVAKCTPSALDPLREVIMHRLQYRNFGSYETLVGNLATDASGANDAGVRWFELRKAGAGGWSLHQEGTYAPDANSRWMGAIAMDGSGNIALGYNVSSSSVYPSLRYAGRLASDPLGTLPQGEYNIIAGSASNGSNRYGDYASMSVDPEDDCTFWFTGEYNPSIQWSTRIAAFKFDQCGGPFHLEVTPPVLDVCAPDDAVYDVSVELDHPGYSDPVTLAAGGNPAGTTTTFSSNPAPPPYTSTLTIGNTGAAAAGHYDIAVVGIAPTATQTTTVSLSLFDAAATISLISPADGATDVAVAPTFTWDGTGFAYTIEIATDPSFNTIVESATTDVTTYTSAGLERASDYFWRVNAVNACGGNTSPVWHFTTAPVPPILLVDDDDDSPDVRGTYTAALDNLGLSYDVWNTNHGDAEPTAGDLAAYDVVIWFTGDAWGNYAGPGAAAETALGTWLDAGHCLFISSQDYHYDRGLTPFMQTYLGASAISDDDGQYDAVTGQGVFAGLGPYTLSFPFGAFPDIITGDATASLAFDGDNGNDAALTKDGEAYRTSFWVFPWEAIASATGREATMSTFVNWCAGLAATYGVDLSANESATGAPGETVSYTMTVTNTGNIADTITLAASGNSWTTTVTPASVTLDPDASASFTVEVTLPTTAVAGSSDVATITATSSGDPGVTATATVTTTALHIVAIPFMVRDP